MYRRCRLRTNFSYREKCGVIKTLSKQLISRDVIHNEKASATVLQNVHKNELKSDKHFLASFPPKYSASDIENKWSEWWESQGFFSIQLPHAQKSKIFSMVMPPPNVTGDLHLGHALTTAIQDALIRWHRMMGQKVVWVPGCDHAGIATQVVVEKKLLKEKQLTRHQIGTAEFLQFVWNWKNEKEANIYRQLQALGASFDSNRKLFTLDDNMCTAVTEAFIKLYNDGLIYRQQKLVNWCCHLQSTISDIEVKHVEVEGGAVLSFPSESEPVEIGFIDTFAYPVFDSDEKILIATTRLETMLGDVAVAVHPKDSRYESLVGRLVVHPFTGEKLPIIADEFVDRTFQTGAVKITPSHNLDDFQVAKKYGLPLIDVVDDAGRIQVPIQPFQGLSRYQAKKAARDALAKMGLYVGRKVHAMSVPTCSRSGDLLELRLKPQWFLKTGDMCKAAVQAVDNGQLKLFPSFYSKEWKECLLVNAQDWCISRQLLWGHRIPAYKIISPQTEHLEKWICAKSEDSARNLAVREMRLDPKQFTLEQDKDVLDTWFSSSLFPLVAFGWPSQTDSFAECYPLSLMETGHDILLFWVARMVMMCQYFTGKLPFNQALLHGMLRDSRGKKMSKSTGNVIDPMDVICGISLKDMKEKLLASQNEGLLSDLELSSALQGLQENFPNGIPQCGADGLRMALLSHDVQSVTIQMNVTHIHDCHKLCNKIWQGVRFMLLTMDKHNISLQCATKPTFDGDLKVSDRWILSCLAQTVRDCNHGFTSYDFRTVTSALSNFWVKQYCDVYLEDVKGRSASATHQSEVDLMCKVLAFCTYTFLRCLSPIMPFLSEELYKRLIHIWGDPVLPSIMFCSYPEGEQFERFRNTSLEAEMKQALGIVNVFRSLKTDYDMMASIPKAAIVCDEAQENRLTNFTETICSLARLESLEFSPAMKNSSSWILALVPNPKITIALHLESGVSKSAQLLKRKEKIETKLNKLKKIISWKHFERRTPTDVKEQCFREKSVLEEELEYILREIEKLKLNVHLK